MSPVGLTAGDGPAVADPGGLPLGRALACRVLACPVLVHPASPVPAATAPPRSKNFRRSMDTRKTVPTLGQSRRPDAASNVRAPTDEGAAVAWVPRKRGVFGEYRGGIYPAVGSWVSRS